MVPLAAWALTMAVCASSQELPLPTLTHARDVRNLGPEQAARGYPVRIRGIITFDLPAPNFSVQDKTAGIYVQGSESPRFHHVLGDLVEVEGVTGPGRFAPVIREKNLRVLGKGTMPKAHLYSLSDLAEGQQDSQWAKVRGVVRAVSIDRTSWKWQMALSMKIASGNGQLTVRVPIPREQDFSSWVDREVVIEGVCGSLSNAERQLVGILFNVPRLSFIKVEAPPNEVPFASLQRFSPGNVAGHHVRVRGVVTYQELGSMLFLQREGKGLRVITSQDTAVKPGDVIDVIGLPVSGESSPMLDDAVFHVIRHDMPPEPLNFDIAAPWDRYDGTLLTTEAKLLQREQRPDGLTLLLWEKGVVYSATLPLGTSPDRLLSIPLDSEIRLTGICLVRNGGWGVSPSFRLLLRSPAEVTVLHAPSWWNLRRTIWLLGIPAGVLLATIAWVVVLGQRVRRQMAALRQKLHSGAVLEERNRIARELHDSLEQELAGITIHLDLASDCFEQAPHVSQHALEMARNMSRHSMVEARKSVWDLRCHLLENGDLVSALKQAVEPLVLRDHLSVDFKVAGHPHRLAPTIEMNLLRIGQEAVVNAARHSGARHVVLELQYHPDRILLCVSDDGQGFTPHEIALAGGGHFGLLDMRERAQSMGSELRIDSSPGGGTRVGIEVLVGQEQIRHAENKGDSDSGR